jgi:hypothetical protein
VVNFGFVPEPTPPSSVWVSLLIAREVPVAQTFMQAGPYVFLSYISGDRGLVLPIIERLHEAGARVWVDFHSIPPGGNYGLEIAKAIQGCSILVVACTQAALESRNVKQEIQLGWKHHRPYLPLLLEPITLPPEIEYWLEGYQWIQVYDTPEEQWMPRVIRALTKAGIPIDASRARGARSTTHTAPTTLLPTVDPVSPTPARPVASPPTVPERPQASVPATPPIPQVVGPIAPSTSSRRGTRFLLAVLAGVGAVVLAVALFAMVALWRGTGGPTPSDSNPADVSQPAGSGAGAPAVAPSAPTSAPAEPTHAAPVMPMGS